MPLIKSISGIRGTIGGQSGEGLNPPDVVRFTAAYAAWARLQKDHQTVTVVVGRDARISGPMVQYLVVSTLVGMGCNVVNIGLASTPTTEIAVTEENAAGGIIITASHNPAHWNALKLLNCRGEFLTAAEGQEVLEMADTGNFSFAEVYDLGKVTSRDYTNRHVELVRALALVDTDAIQAAGFSVAVDAVNSVGGIILPRFLKSLGVKQVTEIICEPTGRFSHNPEPLAGHLSETCEIIRNGSVDVGFVTDPDVDRLAIINEDGSLFNEEYTLVACADYVLQHTPGNTVSNLSSTRALHDITQKYGGTCHASPVGEVHVVNLMKATRAVIGGEGNGGVIYPPCHYGRDALVGIALFLSHLAKSGKKCSALRKTYPDYYISKNKIELSPDFNTDNLFQKIKNQYRHERITETDGLKIDFQKAWVHLRKSNTEPVIRIYAEAESESEAEETAREIICLIGQITG